MRNDCSVFLHLVVRILSTVICPNCGVRKADARFAAAARRRYLREPARRYTAGARRVSGRSRIRFPEVTIPTFSSPRTSDGEEVLVRCLTRAAARDRVIRGQFLKEAELLRGLDHPNLAGRLETFHSDEIYRLSSWTRRRRSLCRTCCDAREASDRVALDFTLQIAAGIEHMHANRVTHRMLTPHRAVVGPHPETGSRRIQLMDLGFARTRRNQDRWTNWSSVPRR